MSKNLILCYSRSGQNYVAGKICSLETGNSRVVAEYIQDSVGGDLFEIETQKDSPTDYMQCTEVAKEELRANARPALKAVPGDISGYQTIFLCGPCWWGTYPMAVFSMLEQLDLSGKQIWPVMTHEGSGSGSCEKDLKKLCKGASIGRCLAIQGSRVKDAKKQVRDWAGAAVSN